jgi:hypothetical protein
MFMPPKKNSIPPYFLAVYVMFFQKGGIFSTMGMAAQGNKKMAALCVRPPFF